MTDPRLSDFSIDQLQELLCVVVGSLIIKREHLNNMIELWGNTNSGYPYIKKKQDEIDRLDLWHTQILSAITKIKIQEIVNSN